MLKHLDQTLSWLIAISSTDVLNSWIHLNFICKHILVFIGYYTQKIFMVVTGLINSKYRISYSIINENRMY